MRQKATLTAEVAIVHITRRCGTVHDVILDLADWEWLKDYAICVAPNHATYYAIVRDAENVPWHLHRLLLDTPKGLEVDHKNGNGLDNRRQNILNVTHAENMQNRFGKLGKSGIRGVCWHAGSGQWQTYCMVDGVQNQLGYYKTIAEADSVVSSFRAQHMPFSQEALPM